MSIEGNLWADSLVRFRDSTGPRFETSQNILNLLLQVACTPGLFSTKPRDRPLSNERGGKNRFRRL